jgi:threonine 3-dehydrogenase
MSALLTAGLDISGVITHRFAAADWAQAFATARGGQCGKVVMDWSGV